jgi:hypothetical protein
MKCVCGNTQCFVCSENIEDYSHFGDKCPLFDDTAERLRTEVATAQEMAIRDVTGTDDGGLEVVQSLVEPELEGEGRQMTTPPHDDHLDEIEHWPFEQSDANPQGGEHQREFEQLYVDDEEDDLEEILAQVREYELREQEKLERAIAETRRINHDNRENQGPVGPPLPRVEGNLAIGGLKLHRKYSYSDLWYVDGTPSHGYLKQSEGNNGRAQWQAFLGRSETIHRNQEQEMQITVASSLEMLEGYWYGRNKELDAFIEEARLFVEETRGDAQQAGVAQERHERARVLLAQAQMEANQRRRETAARQKVPYGNGKQRGAMKPIKGVGKFIPKSWGTKFRRNRS